MKVLVGVGEGRVLDEQTAILTPGFFQGDIAFRLLAFRLVPMRLETLRSVPGRNATRRNATKRDET